MSLNKEPGLLRRCWDIIGKPSAKYSILTLVACWFIGGILFWGGLHAGLEVTNSLDFCTTCHEMRDTVYQEYKETIHYSNRSGVRAICSDCHVPKDWYHKIIRKSQASLELWGKVTGVIDTKEKFEARRMELAKHEWKRMKDSDSRECRNCHNFDAMSPELQKQAPYKKHMQAKADGKTCIDCHKGIAHQLPAGYEDPD